jgi:hypothetical protein
VKVRVHKAIPTESLEKEEATKLASQVREVINESLKIEHEG